MSLKITLFPTVQVRKALIFVVQSILELMEGTVMAKNLQSLHRNPSWPDQSMESMEDIAMEKTMLDPRLKKSQLDLL